MTQRLTLRLGLDELGNDDAEDRGTLRHLAAKKLGIAEGDLPELVVVKRAIDARGRSVRFEYIVDLEPLPRGELGLPHPRSVDGPLGAVVIGDGPAGLFCAYELARRGIRSVVLERGKQVQPRRRDLASLNRRGFVPTESNYCFGEGGAGTFSDGKLYTRAQKRGNVRDVLALLALHGAPARILTDARPHIGSNLLPKVVTALRERLEGCGVTFHFEAKVTDLLVEDGRIAGAKTEDGREFVAPHVVLATGHSGRDVWRMLARHDVAMTPKAFALGVRIEHPQELINEIQYGKDAGHPKLPAAYYRLVAHTRDRGRGEHGVFSFCMCPGGWIVPASTEASGLVVNGMSLTKRASPFANSGLVVTVAPHEWEGAGHGGTFGGVDFQRAIEEASFVAGGGALVAPATRVTDFMKKRGSTTTPATSYKPGLHATRIDDALNDGGLPIAALLRAGLRQLGKRMPRYLSEEAVLVAAETRTSAPIRIERDPDTLEAPTLPGLYPTGEGAGFAGGIISAALDGIRVAEAIDTVSAAAHRK